LTIKTGRERRRCLIGQQGCWGGRPRGWLVICTRHADVDGLVDIDFIVSTLGLSIAFVYLRAAAVWPDSVCVVTGIDSAYISST